MYLADYDEYLLDEFIDKKMHQTRERALKTISQSVHFNTDVSKESFITLFVYSWQESLPAAENLAYQLDLGKLDFLALANDFDCFKRIYLETYKDEYNE